MKIKFLYNTSFLKVLQRGNEAVLLYAPLNKGHFIL